jgi:hypothetical protein
MTDALEVIRVGVQIQPAGTPDYQTWRAAVIQAEDLGADMIFGYDHFHEPVFNKATKGGQAPARATSCTSRTSFHTQHKENTTNV